MADAAMNTEMRIRSGSVPTQRGMDAQRGDSWQDGSRMSIH
jgi:hypothetical protein